MEFIFLLTREEFCDNGLGSVWLLRFLVYQIKILLFSIFPLEGGQQVHWFHVDKSLPQKCRRHSQSRENRLMFHSKFVAMLICTNEIHRQQQKKHEIYLKPSLESFPKIAYNFTFIYEFRTLSKGTFTLDTF